MPHTIIDYNIELHNCFGSETVSNLCLSLIFFFACNRFGVMSDCKLSWLCFSCCLLISLRLFETCRKLPNTFWWISIYISFGQKQCGNSCSSQGCDCCLDDSVVITRPTVCMLSLYLLSLSICGPFWLPRLNKEPCPVCCWKQWLCGLSSL